MENIFGIIDRNSSTHLDELKELLRIPSVSSDPGHESDMARAAEWVRNHLHQLGLEAKVYQTEKHPLVFAQKCDCPGKPTVLFYGHFDVQPVDPVSEWKSDPFEPQVANGEITGRGTSDDKGQMFTHIKAVDAWLKATNSLPVNVKFLIEGEEEIGSLNLPKWLSEHRDLVASDVVVISDTAQFGPGLPSLCTGLRGIATFEIHVKTAEADLHSGSFGGAVPNAVVELVKIVNALHKDDGSIAVPGVYDDVLEASDAEKQSWSELPHKDEDFLTTAQAKSVHGEPGRTTLERIWARPTLEIIGISGGFLGVGHKGIVPCRAMAKGSLRLVPGMNPSKTVGQLKSYAQSLVPEGVELEFKGGHGSPPVSIPVDSKWVAASISALEIGFGSKPVFIREGGSISIVTRFVEEYNMPCLLLGFGLPDDHIHGPNEKLSLDCFRSGIRTSAAFIGELAKL